MIPGAGNYHRLVLMSFKSLGNNAYRAKCPTDKQLCIFLVFSIIGSFSKQNCFKVGWRQTDWGEYMLAMVAMEAMVVMEEMVFVVEGEEEEVVYFLFSLLAPSTRLEGNY